MLCSLNSPVPFRVIFECFVARPFLVMVRVYQRNKDLQLPTRPPSAFALFYRAVHKDAQAAHRVKRRLRSKSRPTSLLQLVGSKWQQLSAAQKQQYQADAKRLADKSRAMRSAVLGARAEEGQHGTPVLEQSGMEAGAPPTFTYHGGGTLQLVAKLGAGTYGCVHSCKSLEDNRLFALKVPNNPDASADLLQEYEFLKGCSSPYTLPAYGLVSGGGSVGMLLELGSSSLLAWLQGGQATGESDFSLWRLVVQACRAIAFTHSMLIIHMDVKPGNMILFEASGALKLGDFGLAARVSDKMKHVKAKGRHVCSGSYRPPECMVAPDHQAGCLFG